MKSRRNASTEPAREANPPQTAATQPTPHSAAAIRNTTPPLHYPNSPYAALSRRRRAGKIARLPNESRELLNTMLHDAAPYSLISAKMAERGHKISADNLSRWHATGYQDWLQHQDWLEEMRARLDFASDIVHENNGELLDAASLRIAVTRMYSLLMDFDPSQLNSRIANQPGAYARILNVLCKLAETSLKCERHRRGRPGTSPNLLSNATAASS